MKHSPVTTLLQTLIRIPSVNPDCAPDGDGEAAMADYLQAYLENIGYQVTQEQVLPDRPNLIARCPGNDSRTRILLGPHLDTVSTAGMDLDSFGTITPDGKILGRGASDTKGPMAAMLQALSNCREILPTLPVAIDFIGFMGEEATQHGSKHFAKHHPSEYQFAIAGEPTSLDIVHTTKGSLWATLTSKGKAAHASQPELGENAILKLTRALDTLDRELNQSLPNYTHPVLGHSSHNIGTIAGGKQPNIVPDSATAQIDLRITPSLHQDPGPKTLVESIIAQHDLPISISQSNQNPPMDVPTDNPWIKRIQSANPDSKTVGAPWFSDAAHLNANGIPAVCIGPGSIDQAHTKDEFIRIEDLENGVTFFENIIQQLKGE